jgi:putative membrane protein
LTGSHFRPGRRPSCWPSWRRSPFSRRSRNAAAAVALGGALIGYVLPLASALSQTVSLQEFAAWALLAGVIQILSFIVVSRVIYKALAARIEAGEMAAGVYLASISIGVGLLNAACMTA